MLYLWIGLNMALASSFAIPTDSILNSYQQGFIDSVNQKTVKVERGFHRYNSFTNQHHWTYSNTDSGTEAIQLLKEASKTKIFSTRDHYRVQSYTPNNLVVFPNLGEIPSSQWHQLLENTPETLLVGDIPQSVLESCASHENRPNRLYISANKRHTAQLRACFPKTQLIIEGIRAVDSTYEEFIQTGKYIPGSIIVSADLPLKSAIQLQQYKGDVIIQGRRIPRWFSEVFAKSSWKSVSFPGVRQLNVKMATQLMSKVDGRIRLNNVTSVDEKVSKKLVGTVDYHLQKLSLPKLSEVSSLSLGHLTRHITVLEVGPISWGPKELMSIQGKDGDIIIYRTPHISEGALRMLRQRQNRTTRAFHFLDVQIDDPETLDSISTLQYFTGLNNSTSKREETTIIDFQFDDWNKGFISLLDPLEKDSGFRKTSQAKESVAKLTGNGLYFDGNKPFEVMKAFVEDEQRWYVLRCDFINDCISFRTDVVTKEYTEYIVNNYVNADLQGRFTDDALQELSKLPGILKLSLPVLTPQQATILSSGSFAELRLQVEEVGTEALLELADYKGKLTLPKQMHHHRALQPYMLVTQQIASYGFDWESESILLAHKMPQDEISIRTTKQPTLEQLESIRQYKGRLGIRLVNNMNSLEYDCKEQAEVPEDCPEPEPPVELTQEMVNLLSISQATSLSLYWDGVNDELDWSSMVQYSGRLNIQIGSGSPEWFEWHEGYDVKDFPSVTPSLLKLVEQYSGDHLTLGAVVLTDELAQRMVKQSYGIMIDAVDVEPAAIQTLLEATHKENMTISTSATPDFCWTHIKNSVCNTDIWDCNEGCDTGEY